MVYIISSGTTTDSVIVSAHYNIHATEKQVFNVSNNYTGEEAQKVCGFDAHYNI